MFVFLGNVVHSLGPEELEILIDHALGVNEDGKVEFLKPKQQYSQGPEDSVVHLNQTQFLFPGFVDTHVHAPQYPNCGIFGDSTLLDWLQTYTFPLESQFKEDSSVSQQIYSRVVDRELQNGTTMASYYGTVDSPSTLVLAKECLKRGQKAQIGRVCMERFCPDDLVDGRIESDIAFIDRVQSFDPAAKTVWPVITPRFAPSCDFETLSNLGKLARTRKLPVQTHLNENVNEISWVAELFPNASSYTDVYHQAALLKHDTVLAHCVHFKHPDELALIKRQNSGISHCPNSNASIASGIAPIKHYLNEGLKVGLGTDVSGGSQISILKNARLALLMSRLLSERHDDQSHNLSVANALFLSSLGGAQVLDRDQSTGNFEVGKNFDAQIVDIEARDSPIDIFEIALPALPKERLYNFLNKWVYLGDDRNTVSVFIDGKLVHERK